MLFLQAHLGTGSLSLCLALTSLQNNYGLSAVPGLVPLGAAGGPHVGRYARSMGS